MFFLICLAQSAFSTGWRVQDHKTVFFGFYLLAADCWLLAACWWLPAVTDAPASYFEWLGGGESKSARNS